MILYFFSHLLLYTHSFPTVCILMSGEYIVRITFCDILNALNCLSVIKSYQIIEKLENILEFRDMDFFFPKIRNFTYLFMSLIWKTMCSVFLCNRCFLFFFVSIVFYFSAQILDSNPPKILLAILYITLVISLCDFCAILICLIKLELRNIPFYTNICTCVVWIIASSHLSL